jgi:hypothetical protein
MSLTPTTVALAIADLVDGNITVRDVSQILLLAMAAVEKLSNLRGQQKKELVLNFVTKAMTDSGVPTEIIEFTRDTGPALIETLFLASGGAAKLNTSLRHWIWGYCVRPWQTTPRAEDNHGRFD